MQRRTQQYFVTATGTDIGKTYWMSRFISYFRAQQLRVSAVKPIISGFEMSNPETDTHHIMDALGLEASEHHIARISPFRFPEPLSPDMAARLDGSELKLHEVVNASIAPPNCDVHLVEGVGGIMVPINAQHTVLDWMVQLNFPVILVTGSYLGTLSHTLTAVRVLLDAELHIHGVLLNASEHSTVSLTETHRSLRAHVPADVPIYAAERGCEANMVCGQVFG